MSFEAGYRPEPAGCRPNETHIMYITSRLLRAASGASQLTAAAVVSEAVNHIGETHGVQFNVGVQIGGDPMLIGVSSAFEHLSDYETLITALGEDQTFQSILQSGEGVLSDTIEDTIWRSRMEPGEPEKFAQVSTANIVLTSVAEAMAFCAEVASTASSTVNRDVGFATAVTGNRSRVLWIGYSGSLAEIEADGEQLEASADYLDLFKRSDGLVVPNSLEQHIWQQLG